MSETAPNDRRAGEAARRERWLPALAALALLPPLGGCIAAAVAVPIVAAGSMAGGDRVRAATPVPETARSSARRVPPTAGVSLTTLTDLPAPKSAELADDDPWQPFVSYALQRTGQPAQSALLVTASTPVLTPRLRDCPKKIPAVAIDLDNGQRAFSPATAGIPSPGLAEGLARLREAGVVVLWISQANANAVREVADALVVSGLDPTGRDPLLLVRHEEDRKQTLRNEANLDVCVIAIAGDRRGDFDELFDYLRDPDSALGLEGMIGAGWFLTPAPFGEPPAPANPD